MLQHCFADPLRVALSAFAVWLVFAISAFARAADPSDLCDAAAQQASVAVDVPLDMLLAITRVETGRSRQGALAPWPWSVNRAGEGFWFETAEEAIAFADEEIAAGGRNFDVGCFQINLRWHSKGFASIEDMFDPFRNAEYAARFLLQLYQSEGGWPEAVAAYHSRTPELAAAYLGKVEAVLGGPSESGADETDYAATQPFEPAPRINRFPLLQAGEQGGFGSLVPAFAPSAPLFGGSP